MAKTDIRKLSTVELKSLLVEVTESLNLRETKPTRDKPVLGLRVRAVRSLNQQLELFPSCDGAASLLNHATLNGSPINPVKNPH